MRTTFPLVTYLMTALYFTGAQVSGFVIPKIRVVHVWQAGRSRRQR
jgi:hypothetical protein